MENSRPRSFCSSHSDFPTSSSPRTQMLPDLMRATSGSSPMMLLQRTLLPQPDSPTMASTSPCRSEKLTPRTACTSPAAG